MQNGTLIFHQGCSLSLNVYGEIAVVMIPVMLLSMPPSRGKAEHQAANHAKTVFVSVFVELKRGDRVNKHLDLPLSTKQNLCFVLRRSGGDQGNRTLLFLQLIKATSPLVITQFCRASVWNCWKLTLQNWSAVFCCQIILN